MRGRAVTFKLITQISYITIVKLNSDFAQAIHHKQATLLLFNFLGNKIMFNCNPFSENSLLKEAIVLTQIFIDK
jgi:hypothetical protein